MADRARAPCDLRRDSRGRRQAPHCNDGVAQSSPRRRLDQDRASGDHRERSPVRPSRGRAGSERHPGKDMNRLLVEETSSVPSAAAIERNIEAASSALLALQRSDGHWVFELEADATIPAEYVLLRHYLAEPVDTALEAKIAVYLRRIQGDHGGWPLFHDGAFDMSASLKAYFALKLIGESLDAPRMVRARAGIRAHGGAG